MRRVILAIFILSLSLNANEGEKGLNDYYKEYMNNYYKKNEGNITPVEKIENSSTKSEEENADAAAEQNQETMSNYDNASGSLLDNLYLSLELGSADFKSNSSSTNSIYEGFKVGYYFTENIRANGSIYIYNESGVDVSYDVGADYLFNIWNFRPFVGLSFVSYDYKQNSDSGIAYRVGGLYRFNDILSFEAGYKLSDMSDIDVNSFFFGLNYHF